MVRKVTFEDAELADLNDNLCVIELVRVASKRVVLGTLYKDAAEVRCGGCGDRLLLELCDDLVAPL
jgi:hypothetical protein